MVRTRSSNAEAAGGLLPKIKTGDKLLTDYACDRVSTCPAENNSGAGSSSLCATARIDTHSRHSSSSQHQHQPHKPSLIRQSTADPGFNVHISRYPGSPVGWKNNASIPISPNPSPITERQSLGSVQSDAAATTASDPNTVSWCFEDGSSAGRISPDSAGLSTQADSGEPIPPIPRAVLQIIKNLPEVLPGNIPICRRRFSVFEDYEKLKEIGSGTYAKVYKLRHQETDKISAGKFLKPHKFPSNTEKRVVQMFSNEIALLAKAQCPGTVQLRAVVWAPDGVLLDLEFIGGGTIWKEKICPNTLTRWDHLMQLIQAVQYMHSCGVVHRDLKPTNILRDENNTLKIADFGWAEEISQLKVSNGEWPGTLEINPPEVLKFTGPLTERIDNYAVGMNFLLFVSNRFVCRQKGLEVAVAVPVILKMVENLRKTSRVPPNFNTETWDIFLGLTDPDPLKRWTLEHVCHHQWVVGHYLRYISEPTISESISKTLWFEPLRALLETYRIPRSVKSSSALSETLLTTTSSEQFVSSSPWDESANSAGGQSPSKLAKSLLHKVLNVPKAFLDWTNTPPGAATPAGGAASVCPVPSLEGSLAENRSSKERPVCGCAASPSRFQEAQSRVNCCAINTMTPGGGAEYFSPQERRSTSSSTATAAEQYGNTPQCHRHLPGTTNTSRIAQSSSRRATTTCVIKESSS